MKKPTIENQLELLKGLEILMSGVKQADVVKEWDMAILNAIRDNLYAVRALEETEKRVIDSMQGIVFKHITKQNGYIGNSNYGITPEEAILQPFSNRYRTPTWTKKLATLEYLRMPLNTAEEITGREKYRDNQKDPAYPIQFAVKSILFRQGAPCLDYCSDIACVDGCLKRAPRSDNAKNLETPIPKSPTQEARRHSGAF